MYIEKDLRLANGKNYHHFDRFDILEHIPDGLERVLDVGCASGKLGENLKRLKGIKEVIGIEINPSVAKLAERVLDKVYIADVEDIELLEYRAYFDCIIYADILEHLKNPWDVLNKHRFLLKNNGFVIASIPNVRYYKVIRDLVRGKWEYREAGILDKTHLRFFTLKGIYDLFESTGYNVIKVHRKLGKTGRLLKILNVLMMDYLKEFMVYQYIIIARAAISG